MKNIEEYSGKKLRRMGQQAENRSDRKNNRTRQKNKTGVSKVESNDSPEIPDRGQTLDILGLPLGRNKGGLADFMMWWSPRPVNNSMNF